MVKKRLSFALIIPRFEDIFHSFYASEIIKGVSLSASHLKIDVLIHITDKYEHDDWLRNPSLNPPYSDGILFADINGDKESLKKVIAKCYPYLVLNNYFKEPINCISIENYKSSFDVVNYLVELGHKKIATIAGDLNTHAGKMRLSGFKEALAKNKIKIDDGYIKVGGFLRTPAREAAIELLEMPDRPTAIFAASDVMALEVIDVAKKKSIAVPDELSIVGFDDNPINIYSPVPLTTVRQPIAEMGSMGLTALYKIATSKQKLPIKDVLSAHLIKRKSCKRL